MTTAPGPMTDREFAGIRARARDPLTSHDEDKARLIDEVVRLRAQLVDTTEHLTGAMRVVRDEAERLRAELAETRRVADHNQAGFLKAMDAVNGEYANVAAERDALAAKLAAVPAPVPDLVLTPEGFEFEGQPMKVMNLTTSERGTEQVQASIRMVTMTEWRRRREAAGLRAALGETGGTER